MTIWKWALCLVSETGTQTVGSHILSPGDLFEWKQGLPNLIWCEHFIYINTRTKGSPFQIWKVKFVQRLTFDVRSGWANYANSWQLFYLCWPLNNHPLLSPFNNSHHGFTRLVSCPEQTTNKTTKSIQFGEDHLVVSTSQQVRLTLKSLA
mgnify:CR=1 FL=1